MVKVRCLAEDVGLVSFKLQKMIKSQHRAAPSLCMATERSLAAGALKGSVRDAVDNVKMEYPVLDMSFDATIFWNGLAVARW